MILLNTYRKAKPKNLTTFLFPHSVRRWRVIPSCQSLVCKKRIMDVPAQSNSIVVFNIPESLEENFDDAKPPLASALSCLFAEPNLIQLFSIFLLFLCVRSSSEITNQCELDPVMDQFLEPGVSPEFNQFILYPEPT